MAVTTGDDLFLSTPSARRATGQVHRKGVPLIFLSTPSARRATKIADFLYQSDGISIHALREEGDRSFSSTPVCAWAFLSTPSARRATASCITPAPRFSFLSTPSARRATAYLPRRSGCQEISIHALREEGDRSRAAKPGHGSYFYPRPPRGGRHFDSSIQITVILISIHALREEGDFILPYFCVKNDISIHALREEGD